MDEETEGPTNKHQILVVDDYQPSLQILTTLLASSGYRVRPASSGQLALRSVAAELPDLIMLDIKMPGMDGYEVCRRLKAEERTSGVPVIFISALDECVDEVEGFAVGGADYIKKPFQREKVLARVSVHLRNRDLTNRLQEANARLEARVHERTAAIAMINKGLEAEIAIRKKTEEALTASRNYLDKIINSVADPIFVKDRQHRWVLLNEAYCDLVGRSRAELFGKSDHDLFLKSEADLYWAKDNIVLTTGAENTSEEPFTDPQGVVHSLVTKRTLYGNDRGELFIVGIIRDMTERKNLDAQLRHAQKMEAIGLLAGGVAHDFNNLLTPILGYADLLIRKLDSDDPNKVALERIKAAGESARELTRRLLAFSRRQVVELRIASLGDVIRDFESLLRRTIREDIEIRIKIDEPLGLVSADAEQIVQVLINTAINAQDAMPQGGALTIEVENLDVDASNERQHREIEPGRYVMLAISDTGVGMDPETMAHIFEPFFTTKEVGKGTGLGLSTVYGIIRKHGGSVTVSSERDKGSRFEILLPRVEGGIKWERRPEAPAADAVARRGETVLVAEDNEMVRALTCEMLEHLGYLVLPSRNVDHCVEIAREYDGEINLLLTDVVMPKMNGRDLFGRLRAHRPELKVLLMSGHASGSIDLDRLIQEGTHFIQKPFLLRGLAQSVRSVLDSAD